MIVFKLAIIAISATFCVISMKQFREDVALVISITAGIIILLVIIDYFSDLFNQLNQIISSIGIDNELVKYLFKIVSIGIISEFVYSTIEESGQKSLADKVLFAGKIIITSLTLPLIKQILEVIGKIL